MAEKPQWYYVDKSDRIGPVAFNVLQAMASSGKITPETLVWKEGMADWQKAATIDGLIQNPAPNVSPKTDARKRSPNPTSNPVTQKPETATAPAAAVTPTVTPNVTPVVTGPGANAPNAGSPTAPVNIQTSAPVAASATPIQTSNEVQIETEASNGRGARSGSLNFAAALSNFKIVGYPCLIVGFLLVLTGKGCDSLGNRWAARLVAKSQMAEQQFDANYQSRINAIQSQIDSYNDSSNPDQTQIQALNDRLRKLRSEMSKERERLRRDDWFDLKSAANIARANDQAWGFFRELVFLFGSMVLSVGLLVIGITGDGSEKWVCLIMLAIITFSLYIGGIAWISSVTNSLPMGF